MAYIGQSLTEGTRRAYTFVATSGQTTFNAVFGVGAVDVYQNGILLQPSDYNSSSGSSVVLGVGAAVNDEITIIAHNTFSVADTVSSSQGGTFAGAVTASNGLAVDDDGATPLTVDRSTDNGGIIDLQKDGTSVASIASRSNAYGVLKLGSTGTGITGTSSHKILPSVNDARSDNTNDLGDSSYRWKDLYLSGGAYLGGTGAANKLDDYEEGNWTATLNNPPSGITNAASTSSVNRYTKVGNLVFVQGVLSITADSSTSNITITGLPYTSASATGAAGGQISRYGSTSNFNPYMGGNTTSMEFYHSNNSGNWNSAQYSEVGAWYVHFNMYYSTDA